MQVALSATIPFMIYDILRRRRTPREALIVALFVLLDPFGLQWAHFYLPEWLIAFCMILGLWLIEQGCGAGERCSGRRSRELCWGFASVARFNFAPMVALLGVMLLLLRSTLLCETAADVRDAGRDQHLDAGAVHGLDPAAFDRNLGV